MIKYVACYVRVSTDEQKKYGFSIQAQIDALDKYCKEHGYRYELFVDEGFSASTMKRPALQKMLNKIKMDRRAKFEGKNTKVFDMVLFTKLDRLSRNVLDANKINEFLKESGCTIKAIDEDDIDTSTADGTFIFNLKVSLAQREIGKTSERIKFVFKNKREKGEVTSGTRKYGYNIVDKKFEINQAEAENIVNLYNYFIKTNGNVKETYEYFIEHFNGKGQDALYAYLRETAYIGKYKLYRKDEYIENYIPRIMEDELFYSVQRLFKTREKASKRTIYPSLFSGLTFCNICQNRMTKAQDNRCKKKVIRYLCDNASRRKVGSLEYKCENHNSVREEYIESYLLNNIKKLAKNHIAENLVVAKQETTDKSLKIKEIKKKINKLKDLYLDDLIDKETYRTDYKNLSKKLNDLHSIDTVPEKKDYSKLQETINLNIEKIYASLSDEEKRTFWLNIIDKIYIEHGEIKEVTFV